MNRYKAGKIYTLRSHSTDKYYIGSTCVPLHKRLYKHKSHYKEYTSGKRKDKISSYEIVKYGDAYIELLEECSCETKAQLLKREGELIREHKADIVNIQIAGALLNNPDYRKDYNNEYRKKNIERIRKLSKEYCATHRDDLIAYHKKYHIKNKHKHNEACRGYYAQNKAVSNQNSKRYYEVNKKAIIDRAVKNGSKKIKCLCGATIAKCSKSRHLKSKKHARNMEQNQLKQIL